MKTLLITASILLALNTSAQTAAVRNFYEVQYAGSKIYKKTHTIKITGEPVDAYFFKRHFNAPYYLPDKFVQDKYRNRMITVSVDSNAKKGEKNYRETTITYDSLGRVTQYTDAGCFICSYMPYSYQVVYDEKSRVGQINNGINSNDIFKFYYDDVGNLVKLEKYMSGKLEKEVFMVK